MSIEDYDHISSLAAVHRDCYPIAMTKPRNFIVYSDKMFTPSESFIPRMYSGFRRLNPVYIGHTINGPIPEGANALDISPLHGPMGVAGFKTFGIVSSKLAQAIRELDPVAIHAHFGKSGAYALPLAKALGLPLIVTYHGGDATKKSNTKNSIFRTYNRRRALLWREADQILACSDFIRQQLLNAGAPDAKTIVHYNAADPNVFQPGEKKNLILFAGRWSPKKGIDTLIEALSMLGSALNGWTVRLCGNRPDGQRDDFEQDLHEKLSASGLNIELAGWVPADDMPKQWAEARIACVPSKRAPSGDAEGLPMVCIEAMLSACALAATRHSGIMECVVDDETGYLVDEGDAVALAESLRTMLTNLAGTTQMGKAGRARALEHFNLEKQSVKLEERILQIANLSQ